MDEIRVAIADDNSRVRKGLRFFLDRHPMITVVCEASDGIEALDCVNQHAPDVLLLDMEMPRLDGIGVVRKLTNSKSLVRVLVLSAYTDQQYIDGVLGYGAAGYLTKDESPEKIIEAVERAAKGESGFYSQRVAEKFDNPPGEPEGRK